MHKQHAIRLIKSGIIWHHNLQIAIASYTIIRNVVQKENITENFGNQLHLSVYCLQTCVTVLFCFNIYRHRLSLASFPGITFVQCLLKALDGISILACSEPNASLCSIRNKCTPCAGHTVTFR
jgi:hypothetical protein